MTANLRISHSNRVPSATLSCSPTPSTSGPVGNLKTIARDAMLIASATGATIISGYWASSQSLSCCILNRTNLAPGDTWRLQVYANPDWTTQVWDSGTAAAVEIGVYSTGEPSAAAMYFTLVSGKSFRLTVTSAAALQATTLWLGAYMQAAYNPAYGLIRGRENSNQRGRTAGGSLTQQTGDHWRTLAFDLFVRTEADRATWDAIDLATQSDPTVWLSVFPGAGGTQERGYSMLGWFDDTLNTKLSAPNMFDFSVKLTEV